tara:strand:- start:1812 stop:2711 length:900 start_codon:yes stop_codon:yes gene_type:complete
MPTFNNYVNFITINLAFFFQIILIIYFVHASDIKKNWPKYRCNPSYWMFSDDVTKDFTHCAQNAQLNSIGFSLQPLSYLMSSINSMNKGLSDDINNLRKSSSLTRYHITGIVSTIYNVFMSLVVNIQKMTYGIQDMVGKLTGVIVSLLYILEGSNKTMMSSWNGPTGQTVRSLSCFHPNTKMKLICGSTVKMKKLKPNDILFDGSRVHATMKIAPKNDLFVIDSIIVSESHHIWDNTLKQFVKVGQYRRASPYKGTYPKYYSCLITSSGKIGIDGHLFLDWEDDNVFALKQLLNNYRHI